MRPIKKLTKFMIPVAAVAVMAGCTKLDEKLGSTLTADQTAAALGASGTGLLLQAAYADLTGPFFYQDGVFSLEENTSDESLVPTRGGDWDDNGVWRILHSHGWDANHGQILSVFNSLNKINFDATNVLTFKPNAGQEAEARFLRAYALYYLLDLYGQYPFRNPGDNLLNAPVVKKGADGAQFIIDELNAVLPNLPAGNGANLANQDACKTLLMKCYLQRGVFTDPHSETPAFASADLDQVISLGNSIINSGKYSFTSNYFKNFTVDNDVASTEAIFRYPNASGVSANHGGIEARWNMTLHYNSFKKFAPNAGWNGFSTIGDFYKSFGVAAPTTYGLADTLLDTRLGRRYYSDSVSTQTSGIRPGFLVGQQYDADGTAQKDRKGNPLAFDPNIAADQKETGSNLEVTGIRVIKYVPDYTTDSKFWGGPAGNDLMIFRYSDVVLMVAEAKMRKGDIQGGVDLVNSLRTARGAAPVDASSFVLANPANPEDPNTLIAERGREFYWESLRRTDLLRFGIFLKPWQYKPTDDKKYMLFPIPSQALASNPNLKQNDGY